ncbi:RES family NAD+ phosphorylase [Caballeronia sp.]|uniref:RES family NAD+ phosphorylase n=1 Tax=Caballeronia sp. TaxID=1931223 RepID=UPI003C40B1A4
MKLFRVAKDKPGKYRADDLSGNGASVAGGRWNPMGMPALYTSLNAATAVLEVRVHLSGFIPAANLFLVEVDIPDVLISKGYEPSLPTDWNELTIPTSTIEIGRRWLSAAKSVAMKVPSVVCPADWNVILNPHHSDFRKVKVTRQEPFSLDARLFR